MLSIFSIPIMLWAAVCFYFFAHGGQHFPHLMVSGIAATFTALLLIAADITIFIKSRNYND